jgi:hypothetical protein
LISAENVPFHNSQLVLSRNKQRVAAQNGMMEVKVGSSPQSQKFVSKITARQQFVIKASLKLLTQNFFFENRSTNMCGL